jgi:uncharacterized repeat protein (TIGR02543 family)
MRKSIYVAAAVFLLLLAGGCDTATGPESGHGQNSRAMVSLAIAGTGGRSVLPANAAVEDVKAWRLQGGKTEPQGLLIDKFTDPAGQTLYLETGVWNFTLEGYQDEAGETLVLRGTITGQDISLDGPNTLLFTVAPVLEGEGSVKITINLPEGHGITQVKVFKTGVELESPITPEENSIVFETAHEAGDYYFSFRLYKENPSGSPELYGVVSELVQVRLNLTSEETYTLGPEDLNHYYIMTYHGEGAPNPDYYRRTDAPVLPTLDNREGYDFKGWHDNVGLTGEPVTEILPLSSMEDRDFYAAWTPIAYTVQYNANGGEGVMVASAHTYGLCPVR